MGRRNCHRRDLIQPTAEKQISVTYHVEGEIMKQEKMLLDGSVELGWDVMAKSRYREQFHDLGKCVLFLAVQSADVERSCKAHGHIHTNVRNHLKNKTGQKLLFLYVNLRSLRKVDKPLKNILSTILEDVQDNMSSLDGSTATETV